MVPPCWNEDVAAISARSVSRPSILSADGAGEVIRRPRPRRPAARAGRRVRCQRSVRSRSADEPRPDERTPTEDHDDDTTMRSASFLTETANLAHCRPGAALGADCRQMSRSRRASGGAVIRADQQFIEPADDCLEVVRAVLQHRLANASSVRLPHPTCSWQTLQKFMNHGELGLGQVEARPAAGDRSCPAWTAACPPHSAKAG